MKKIQMSLTALSVIAGSIGAVAFRTAPQNKNTSRVWFSYTGANQTAASYNDASNYKFLTSQDPTCDHAGVLCVINVTATSIDGKQILASGGAFGAPLGTNIKANVALFQSAVVTGALGSSAKVTEINQP